MFLSLFELGGIMTNEELEEQIDLLVLRMNRVENFIADLILQKGSK